MKFLLSLAAVVLFAVSSARADAPGPIIGIGTELRSSEGHAVVEQIIPGSPAEQAGVRSGDRIVKVDDTNVETMPVAQVARLLHGARDSVVKITVDRGGGLKNFQMKREILVLAGPPAPQP